MAELIIENVSQLVTLAGPARPRAGAEMRELSIIIGGALLARDGVIVAVGAASEVEPQAGPDAIRIDARKSVVMPGFVDAHTHPVFAGTREDEYEMRAAGLTYQQNASQGGGIRSTVRKTREASEDDLFEMALPRVRSLLEHGTTSVEAKSGYGRTLDDELKILRVMRRLKEETSLEIVPTFLGAHAVPRHMNADEYIDLVIDGMLPRVAGEKLAEFCDVFCEPGYFDIEQSRRILTAARKLGLNLRIHADQLTNSGGAQLAAKLKTTTADHLEKTEEQGIAAMKAAGVQ